LKIREKALTCWGGERKQKSAILGDSGYVRKSHQWGVKGKKGGEDVEARQLTRVGGGGTETSDSMQRIKQ